MLKILYICTHNRCRSILCEALTNHLGEGRLEAKSAGSEPVEQVHPLTLTHLARHEVETQHLESKSWNSLETYQPDVIITVCDDAAGEVCPAYFSKAVKVHWGLKDPSRVDGSEQVRNEAFSACIGVIKQRIAGLLAIANHEHSPEALRTALQQLVTE